MTLAIIVCSALHTPFLVRYYTTTFYRMLSRRSWTRKRRIRKSTTFRPIILSNSLWKSSTLSLSTLLRLTSPRLINYFNEATKFYRNTNGALPNFVSRFRFVAANHLYHDRYASSSQIGQVLAIMLLNNSKLEESTLNNYKL